MNTQNLSVYPFGSGEGSGGSGIMQAGAGKFPNPFCDIASEYMPSDLPTIFELCEYMYLSMGTYRTASRRVVRYFLTELVLEGESDKERELYNDFLNDILHIMPLLADIGDDFMVYGNVFLSTFFPFDRFLICPECGMSYHVETIQTKFKPKTSTFEGVCIGCKNKVIFKREDRRSPDKDRIAVIRWNPKQIKLRIHPISGKIEYYLEIDPNFAQKIRDGNSFYLNQTPWSMVKTCCNMAKADADSVFQLRDDAIYHLKDSTLAGLPIKGWSIPSILPNFKLAYYIQMLRRYDEAIALDFIVPFRILFPKAQSGPGGNDPLSTMNMGGFISKMQDMVVKKRKNITDIQVSPFEIGYEMLGGEAQALSPKESIAVALDELLNAIGLPAELYKGSLSIQAFPVALRLFEKTWGALVEGLNGYIAWLLKMLSRHFLWGDIKGSLRSVTLADDIERKALALQAAAGMDISKATAYRPLGIDYLTEQRRVVEEQEEIQKLQQEAMERAQAGQMQQGGGGMPGGPGGDVGSTPGDVAQQAQDTAKQLLLQTPETQRRGELIKIKHSNPTLHALVIQAMDDMRAEFRSQGQAMMMEQAKMASAEIPKEYSNIPSPFVIQLLVADQISDYNRNDLRKMAMQIKHKYPKAKEAFHFIFAQTRGW